MFRGGRMQQTLTEIQAASTAVSTTVGTALDACGKVSLDLAAATSTNGETAESIFARIATLISGSESIGRTDPNKLSLAPTNRLRSLSASLSTLNQNAAEFTALLATVGEAQGYDNSTGVLSGTTNSANVRTHLDALQTATDKALESYLVIAAAARPKGIGSFAAASGTLAQKATEASQVLENLKSEADALRKRSEQLDAQAATVARTQGEAQRLTEEIEKVRKTAEENEQKILASSASAEEARSKAATVDAQVQAYRDKFMAFEQALDSRDQAFKSGQTRLAGLEGSLKKKDEEADELIAKAKKMLGGATIAGLSETYHNKVKSIDTQLMWSRVGFYVAMSFLFVSVLVALNLTNFWGLITGVIPPIPEPQPGVSATTIAVRTFASLGSRALVVLPSLLLAGFAAHRHSALFRLREEYSHKETMAVSVQGFKEQAPAFQEPIAAAVFQELLSNPAVSMEGKTPEEKPNGFIQRLISPVVDNAVKKMLELRDGAISHGS